MRARVTSEAVVALVLALVVIGTAAAVGSGTKAEDRRSSTFVDDRHGAHALYLMLQDCGVAVSRQVDLATAETPTDRTHVVLAPSFPVGRAAAGGLLDWAERGGRLVVIAAPYVHGLPTATDLGPVLGRIGLAPTPIGSVVRDVQVPGAAWAREVRNAEWPARQSLELADAPKPHDPRAGEPEKVAENSAGVLAYRVPFGSGEVLAVSDESLFVNETLLKGDNAVLAVRLLADGERRVVFDEYHHGFAPGGGPAGFVARAAGLLLGTWVGRAVLVLALAGLVYAAGAAVRLGAPLPEPRPRRRALREHADALGRLLEGAHASPEALGVLVDGVRRAVASRVGLPPAAPASALQARLERSRAPGAKELARAVAEARAAQVRGRMKDVEFARLAANLAEARRRLLHGA